MLGTEEKLELIEIRNINWLDMQKAKSNLENDTTFHTGSGSNACRSRDNMVEADIIAVAGCGVVPVKDTFYQKVTINLASIIDLP